MLEILVHQGQSSIEVEDQGRCSILGAVAAAFQTASIDAILPSISILETLRHGQWAPYFLRFSDLFSRLGRERFQSLLLPQFQKFVLEQSKDNVDGTLLLVPKLLANEQRLLCPPELEESILERLESPTDETINSQRLSTTYLAATAIANLKLKAESRAKVQNLLLSQVQSALEADDTEMQGSQHFALGPVFATLLENCEDEKALRELWSVLCSNGPGFARLPQFWSNLSRYMNICTPSAKDLDAHHMMELEASLWQSLSIPSHEVRRSALHVIQTIYQLRNEPVPQSILAAANIESTPISLETSRSISMNIRSLVSGSIGENMDHFVWKAITSYCFGLLHFRLSPAWEDAIDALIQISKHSVGEEAMIALVQTWLESTGVSEEEYGAQSQHQIIDLDSTGFQVASDFECPNLAKFAAICQQTFHDENHGYLSGDDQFRAATKSVPLISPNARTQALRVLNKMPSVAEKRSRMLVPVLLRWAAKDDAEDGTVNTEQAWSRKDQKAMLAVFAKFTNPKLLFKSKEVRSALLNLCANGDVEIQRSALQALLAWKDPAINSYEEHLMNLLDEARFREEISVFLQAQEHDEAVVLEEHRSQLMPVLLRLLYGRAVAGSKHEQGSLRRAIFVSLSRYGEDVLRLFVDIALGTTGDKLVFQNDTVNEQAFRNIDCPLRQQLGTMNMMNDMLEVLGSDMATFTTRVLNVALIYTINATRQLDRGANHDIQDTSLLRSVRQVGIQCLVKVFSTLTVPLPTSYTKLLLDELFAQRLERFASENSQSISGLLRLLSTWSSEEACAPYLISHLKDLPKQISELLQETHAKDDVRLFVLQNILDKLLQDTSSTGLTSSNITAFVQSILDVIRQQPSKDVLNACVETFTKLAAKVKEPAEVTAILEVCAELLTRPNKIVSPPTKTNVLKTLSSLIDLAEGPVHPALYDALCGLFSRLQDLEARTILSMVFHKLCMDNNDLVEVAEICDDLNALRRRLDEPDNERRERGFSSVYKRSEALAPQQWKPVLHNCLFYVRDTDDLVNRSSASRALQLFIDTASRGAKEFQPQISAALLPGVEYGMKNPSELVRAEYLHILGHLVEIGPEMAGTRDMKILTVGGDDEASFFTNILHIQQHRRLRALRRLSDEADKLNTNNVIKLFIPLLEHFVFDQADGDAGRTLADQSVTTIGALGGALGFSAFKSTFRRYVGFLSSKPDHESLVMRLLSTLVDGLVTKLGSLEDSETNGDKARRTSAIVQEFLPPLTDYIHLKDESTVDRRLPVAVTVAKLVLLLPQSEIALKLAPVLTDVCHVLRSRSQEARDQTRKTLNAILSLTGPTYLGFILKELRSALQQGYQLHVLSFTVHSLLVNRIESFQPGDLDDCLPELSTIIMDDIFGVTGQEKDAEEYKSGMKEVKSSKSFDTMELLARVTPVQRLGQLTQPLRALLSEKVDSKMLKKIDDLLTRLRKGVDQNPAANSREMLIFCHELARQINNSPELSTYTNGTKPKVNRYLVQLDKANKTSGGGVTTNQTFKLASFALNMLRKILRRHDDLLTPANMAGFLPITGDALMHGQQEVQLSAMKLLATTMKLPLAGFDDNAPVYVQEAVRVIKSSTSMSTEFAKAALELTTAVLREKRSVHIREKDIAEVLKAIKGDIDEPDRQGILYKFVRAVLGRKLMFTEVYELIDEVAKVTVTNPDRNVQENARGAYIQFVMDYPQGKDRWNKLTAWIIENLKYEHPSGRRSVMELLHQLLPKLRDAVTEELVFTLFVALVPVRASDPDQACQQMAGMLIAKLFEQASDEQRNSFLLLMSKWLKNEASPNIQTAALQCWTILLRTRLPGTKHIEGLRFDISTVLDTDDADALRSQDGTHVVQNALQTFEALVDTSPDIAFAKQSASIWKSLQRCITIDQFDAKEMSSKLLETYFSHLASSTSKSGMTLSSLPIQGSHGLSMDIDEMRQLCYASLRVLRAEHDTSSDSLLDQIARNLVFLGRCFTANNGKWRKLVDPSRDERLETEDFEDYNSSAIGYLFNRLSYIIRQEGLPVNSRITALQCQAALVKHVSEIPNLTSVVRPPYLLTDPTIMQPSGDAHRSLVEKARELLEVIQQKVGMQEYLSALGAARAEAKSKRDERRQKRKIDAVSAPERWAREKRKKHDAKKVKSKARSAEAVGRRRGW